MRLPSESWLAATHRRFSREGRDQVFWVADATNEWLARESIQMPSEAYPPLLHYIANWFEKHTTLQKDSQRPAIRAAWVIDGGFVEVWVCRPTAVSRNGLVRSFEKLHGKRTFRVIGLAPEQQLLLRSSKIEQTKLRNWKLMLQSIVVSEVEARDAHQRRLLGDDSKMWLDATAKHVQASGILLCDARCRFMGADSSRFGLECALKLLWIHFKGFTEKQFFQGKQSPKHDLAKLLKDAPAVLSTPAYKMAESRLQDFPDVGNRYHDPYVDTNRLWRCYECAMRVAEEAARLVMDDVCCKPPNC